MVGNFSCSFTKRSAYKNRVSVGSLQLTEACWHTPTTHEIRNKCRFLRQKIVQSLYEDQEI